MPYLFKHDTIAVSLYIQQYIAHDLSNVVLNSCPFIQKIQA